jgi:uncharacterized protein YcfL
MKKLLILSIGLLLLAGCDKENESNCSVCTVITSNSSTGESTTTYVQSDLGDCDETQEEFKEEMNTRADTEDLLAQTNAIIQGQAIEVSHTITCVYE